MIKQCLATSLMIHICKSNTNNYCFIFEPHFLHTHADLLNNEVRDGV